MAESRLDDVRYVATPSGRVRHIACGAPVAHWRWSGDEYPVFCGVDGARELLGTRDLPVCRRCQRKASPDA